MKIKRILVEEKEFVMGEIERFLCIEGISYVKVENEIHIPNLILRFYDFEKFKFDLWNEMMERESQEYINLGLFIINDKSRKEMEDTLGSIDLSIGNERNGEEMISRLKRFSRVEPLAIHIEPQVKNANTPYPPVKINKKKQLQLENGRVRSKLK